MNRLGLSLVLVSAILLSGASCGKKGPPFLPQKSFEAKAVSLEAEVKKGYVLLKGDVQGGTKDTESIKGAKVYFAEYSPGSAPSEGSPIEYEGFHLFGQEVVKDGKLLCKIPGIKGGQIYYFRVHLVGSDESLGPGVGPIKVVAE